jgi:DNA-binding MarR family transcriptional regulator
MVAYRQYGAGVDDPSTSPYGFGDLLALARLAWLRQMAARLGALGFHHYHRGDGAVLRLVVRGPVPLGRAGQVLGVTRQAARKIVGRLESQGYVATERDHDDARVVNVVATPAGAEYARALVRVTDALNREMAASVTRSQLEGADAVLRASITDPRLSERAASLVPTPQGHTGLG